MGRPSKASIAEAESLHNKARLTLTQLAGYDDILTDALVDHVYFWATIRKNRSKYNQTRGISEDEISHVLLYDVIVAKDLTRAEEHLLELPGLKKYNANLKSGRARDDFRRHMRKYLSIWMADCPFEVSTTNRYTITTHEAAATARRFIRSGETIKYLCGNLVKMTPEEEKDMGLTRRDFSVVLSSRKKTPSLFLGPARFANHDCNANARLVINGTETMSIIAARDIEIGQEITVNYGIHYFGSDNCECLCATCESHARGGWCPKPLSREENQEDIMTPQSEEPSSLRDSRKRSLSAMNDDSDANASLHAKRVKSTSLSTGIDTGLRTPPESISKSSADPTISASIPPLTEPITEGYDPSKTDTRHTPMLESTFVPRPPHMLRAPSTYRGSEDPLEQQDRPETRIGSTGVVDEKVKSLIQWMHAAALKYEQRHMRLEALYHGKSSKSMDITPITMNVLALAHRVVGQSDADTRDSKLSTKLSSIRHRIWSAQQSRMRGSSDANKDLNPNVRSETWKASGSVPRRGRPPRPLHTLSLASQKRRLAQLEEGSMTQDVDKRLQITAKVINPALRVTAMHVTKNRITPINEDSASSSEDEAPEPIERVPGDYIRTRLLLSLNHSRWVDCRTCDNCWVQTNGYQTRKECPRCERHSKLYGFQWPKTENARGETQQRVMDHRTVHRFIAPDEEREEKKRGRGVFKVDGVVRDDSLRNEGTSTEDDSLDAALSSRLDRRLRVRPTFYDFGT